MNAHDLGYTKLFSHARMVQDLVAGFIREGWTAAMDVSDLIEESPPGLEAYRPHMRYLLVDGHRYQEDELKPMRNVVAALFRLEKSRHLEDVRQVVLELHGWLQGPEQRELRRTFSNWLIRILLPRLAKKDHPIPEAIPEINDMMEAYTMLAETAEGWTREWLREGRQQGEARLLLRQLTRRFGDVAAWVHEKVHAADVDTLELWGDRVLDARTLEDVIGPNPVD